MNRNRAMIVIKTAAVISGGTLLLSSCSLPSQTEEVLDPVESFQAELVEAGVDDDVAECVIHLGQREIERAELSAVAADELEVICQRALGESTISPVGSELTADEANDELAIQPFTNGDDASLDQLWSQCADGVGASCDQLFQDSPVGSEYEQFGVSCGQRDAVLDCAELDEEEIDDELVPQVYREWQESQGSDGTQESKQPSPTTPAAASLEVTASQSPAQASKLKESKLQASEPERLKLRSPTTKPIEQVRGKIQASVAERVDLSRVDRVRAAGSIPTPIDDYSSRAEQVRAEVSARQQNLLTVQAAVEASGFGVGSNVDERAYVSPEVAGRTVTRSAYELEQNHPLTNLDLTIAGIINP